MRKLLKPVAVVVTFLLTMVAFAGAASASYYLFYEPQVPAKLRK